MRTWMVEGWWAINVSWSVPSGRRSSRTSGKLWWNSSVFVVVVVGPFAGPSNKSYDLVNGQFQFQFPHSSTPFWSFLAWVYHIWKRLYVFYYYYSVATTGGNSLEAAPPSRSHCERCRSSFPGSLSHSEGRLPPCQRGILSTYIDSRCTSASVAWAERIWFDNRKSTGKTPANGSWAPWFWFSVFLCLRLLHSQYTIHT